MNILQAITMLFIVIIAIVNTIGSIARKQFVEAKMDNRAFVTINTLVMIVMVSLVVFLILMRTKVIIY